MEKKDEAGVPKPPPARPPKQAKHKPSQVKRPEATHKFNLTEVQKIQVQIIDWKRHSVRALLVVGYVALTQFFIYLTLLAGNRDMMQGSYVYQIAFYCFFPTLVLYLVGCGVALKAISFIYNSLKFYLGILAMILAVIMNISLFLIGSTTNDEFEFGFPRKMIPICATLSKLKEDDPRRIMCEQAFTVKIALICIPAFLPLITVVCAIVAVLAAYKAIYLVPQKLLPLVVIDSVSLEPYETYDFYVGRNIPRIPGYDETFDDAHYVQSSQRLALIGLDDNEADGDVSEANVGDGQKEQHKKHKKGHHHLSIVRDSPSTQKLTGKQEAPHKTGSGNKKSGSKKASHKPKSKKDKLQKETPSIQVIPAEGGDPEEVTPVQKSGSKTKKGKKGKSSTKPTGKSQSDPQVSGGDPGTEVVTLHKAKKHGKKGKSTETLKKSQSVLGLPGEEGLQEVVPQQQVDPGEVIPDLEPKKSGKKGKKSKRLK